MHYAALQGHRRTLEWLHAYGAWHSPRDSLGETPLHLAAIGVTNAPPPPPPLPY